MKQRAAPPLRKKKNATSMPFQNSSFSGATIDSTLRSKNMPQPRGSVGRLSSRLKASPYPNVWIIHAPTSTRYAVLMIEAMKVAPIAP
jgi:hypothetical protein